MTTLGELTPHKIESYAEKDDEDVDIDYLKFMVREFMDEDEDTFIPSVVCLTPILTGRFTVEKITEFTGYPEQEVEHWFNELQKCGILHPEERGIHGEWMDDWMAEDEKAASNGNVGFVLEMLVVVGKVKKDGDKYWLLDAPEPPPFAPDIEKWEWKIKSGVEVWLLNEFSKVYHETEIRRHCNAPGQATPVSKCSHWYGPRAILTDDPETVKNYRRCGRCPPVYSSEEIIMTDKPSIEQLADIIPDYPDGEVGDLPDPNAEDEPETDADAEDDAPDAEASEAPAVEAPAPAPEAPATEAPAAEAPEAPAAE